MKRLKNTCPFCGTLNIGKRVRTHKKEGAQLIQVKPYLCYVCGAEFIKPVKVEKLCNTGKFPQYLKRRGATQ